MGKGTTHKCDWKPTTLDAAIAAMRLHAHTAKILSNPKAFNRANDFHNRSLMRKMDDFVNELTEEINNAKIEYKTSRAA